MKLRVVVALSLVLGPFGPTSCLVPPPPGSEAKHPDSAASKEAGIVIARLGELREEKGLLPPKVLVDIQEMAADDALALERGECDGNSALGRVLQKTFWKLKQDSTVIQGWYIATNKLDLVPFPPEVLKTKTLRVAVVVARTMPKQPGMYGVILTAEVPGAGLDITR